MRVIICSKYVFIGGLDKRQATIHLCIRAEGEQCVRAAIIFRGTGRRLSSEELAFYNSIKHLVAVYFQPKVSLISYLSAMIYSFYFNIFLI